MYKKAENSTMLRKKWEATNWINVSNKKGEVLNKKLVLKWFKVE